MASPLSGLVEEHDIRYGMRMLQVIAREWQWRHHRMLPLEEYLSAGHEALTKALYAYDPTKSPLAFRTFCRQRLQWAMRQRLREHTGRRAQKYQRFRDYSHQFRVPRWTTQSGPEQGCRYREWFAKLPPRSRAILVQMVTEGWSQKTMAHRLGITESRISQLIHQIRGAWNGIIDE